MKNTFTVTDEGGPAYRSPVYNSSGSRGWFFRNWSKLAANPFILFLPFLIFFIAYILIKNNNAFESDEERYYIFAQHLLNGYYSDPAPKINLWNGPGYPIFLMPFVALGLPLVIIPL